MNKNEKQNAEHFFHSGDSIVIKISEGKANQMKFTFRFFVPFEFLTVIFINILGILNK